MDFFKTKKKKAAPKPAANLNQDAPKDVVTQAADDKAAGEEGAAPAEGGAKPGEAEPISPSKANLVAMDLKKVQQEQAKADAANAPKQGWGAVTTKAGPQQFVVGANNPGAMNTRKFPELQNANKNTNITVGVNIGTKAEVSTRTNRFANMEADGDCDDETDERKEVVVLAHATKKKGETIAATLDREITAAKVKTGADKKNGEEDEDEDEGLTDRQKKEKEEKERKKAEKKAEAERKKAEIRENMKAIKKGDDQPKETVEGEQADHSKFLYASFSTVAAAEKYEGRHHRDYVAPQVEAN